MFISHDARKRPIISFSSKIKWFVRRTEAAVSVFLADAEMGRAASFWPPTRSIPLPHIVLGCADCAAPRASQLEVSYVYLLRATLSIYPPVPLLLPL